MKMKRVLQGTAVAALATAAWIGAGSIDASAAVDVGSIGFSPNEGHITVDPGDALEVMVGFAKGKAGKDLKISNWDIYDGSAEIDLSKLKSQDSNYIVLKTDDMSAPIALKLDATGKKFKGALNPVDGKIVFQDDGKDVTPEDYEVKVNDASGWMPGSDISIENIESLQYQGGTIYVRKAGIDKAAVDKTETGKTDNGGYKVSTEKQNIVTPERKEAFKDCKVIEIGSLAAKEVKLSVSKQANGPSIKADYVKGTVKAKKGVEYRLVDADGLSEPISKGAFCVDGAAEDVANILAGRKSAVLEVRVAASIKDGATGLNVKKNKCASKWKRIEIEAPKTMAEAGLTTPNAVSAATTKEAINVVATGSSAYVTAKLESKKDAYTGNIIIESKTDAIDYFCGTAAPTAKDKTKSIKAKKETVIKDAAGKNLWIRVAGDKKDSKWAGAWENLGKVPAK